jgi:hypothetical protein
MGLDQYAHRVVAHDTDNREEIAYWRKHPNLQGWMEQLWREKGGEGEFNCVDVELTLDDLRQLEASIEGAELPETEGFFFGNDSDDYYREQDLEFIADASEAIEQGYKVVYTSWW